MLLFCVEVASREPLWDCITVVPGDPAIVESLCTLAGRDSKTIILHGEGIVEAQREREREKEEKEKK